MGLSQQEQENTIKATGRWAKFDNQPFEFSWQLRTLIKGRTVRLGEDRVSQRRAVWLRCEQTGEHRVLAIRQTPEGLEITVDEVMRLFQDSEMGRDLSNALRRSRQVMVISNH